MTIDRRLLLAAGLAAAAAPGAAFAAAPEIMPAKKMFPFLDLYLGLPQADRSRFNMTYFLRQNGKPVSVAGIVLVGPGGTRTPLPVGADGRFQRLPTLAELKAGANVEVPPHNAKYQRNLVLEPLVRMAEVINAADLAAAIAQCGAAIRKNAGVLGFAAPKISQVVFIGASGGTAVLAGGKTVALPLFKTLPSYNPSALPGVSQLKFAKAPTRAVLA